MRTCSRSHDLTQTADAVGNSGLVNYISLGGASRGVFTTPSYPGAVVTSAPSGDTMLMRVISSVKGGATRDEKISVLR